MAEYNIRAPGSRIFPEPLALANYGCRRHVFRTRAPALSTNLHHRGRMIATFAAVNEQMGGDTAAGLARMRGSADEAVCCSEKDEAVCCSE